MHVIGCSWACWQPVCCLSAYKPQFEQRLILFSASTCVSLPYKMQTPTWSTIPPSSLPLLFALPDTPWNRWHGYVACTSRQYWRNSPVFDAPFTVYMPTHQVLLLVFLLFSSLLIHTRTQPPILQHYSGYSVMDIGNCLQDLHRTFAMAPKHSQQAIRQKYSSQKWGMYKYIRKYLDSGVQFWN